MGASDFRPRTIQGALVTLVLIVAGVIVLFATNILTIIVGVLAVAVAAFVAYALGVRAWRWLAGAA